MSTRDEALQDLQRELVAVIQDVLPTTNQADFLRALNRTLTATYREDLQAAQRALALNAVLRLLEAPTRPNEQHAHQVYDLLVNAHNVRAIHIDQEAAGRLEAQFTAAAGSPTDPQPQGATPAVAAPPVTAPDATVPDADALVGNVFRGPPPVESVGDDPKPVVTQPKEPAAATPIEAGELGRRLDEIQQLIRASLGIEGDVDSTNVAGVQARILELANRMFPGDAISAEVALDSTFKVVAGQAKFDLPHTTTAIAFLAEAERQGHIDLGRNGFLVQTAAHELPAESPNLAVARLHQTLRDWNPDLAALMTAFPDPAERSSTAAAAASAFAGGLTEQVTRQPQFSPDAVDLLRNLMLRVVAAEGYGQLEGKTVLPTAVREAAMGMAPNLSLFGTQESELLKEAIRRGAVDTFGRPPVAVQAAAGYSTGNLNDSFETGLRELTSMGLVRIRAHVNPGDADRLLSGQLPNALLTQERAVSVFVTADVDSASTWGAIRPVNDPLQPGDTSMVGDLFTRTAQGDMRIQTGLDVRRLPQPVPNSVPIAQYAAHKRTGGQPG